MSKRKLSIAVGAVLFAMSGVPAALAWQHGSSTSLNESHMQSMHGRWHGYMHADKSAIKDLQQRLSSAGYDVGKIDGVVGAKTHQALRSFQRDHHMTASGRLDATTIEALGMEESAAVGATSSTPASGSVGLHAPRSHGVRSY